MQILKLDMTQDWMPVVDRAVQVLQKGGTMVFPTDTLYGLGCNALDPHAVGRVFDIKHRSYVKALPMFVRDISWARELAYITPEHERIIMQFWPGKVTFVLLRRNIVPAIMSGGGRTIGLRAPDDRFIQTLLKHFGYPLAGTSANMSGRNPVADAASLVQIFSQTAPQPNLVLDGGHLPESAPSTVVDLSGPQPRILRQGAVRADRILAVI